ncbi:hypothetical protein C943_03216 [Mariniradius saccharolyticus AK6]|uniref:Uncharacterized protein n=1 Tax=Mariniradius saccharolyticus AK6 TaxID=1239962 RepID=M7XJB7_9BACT|nr:hypothetical protein C943_03216 [Mariniradius saccharolyticus AK6]
MEGFFWFLGQSVINKKMADLNFFLRRSRNLVKNQISAIFLEPYQTANFSLS